MLPLLAKWMAVWVRAQLDTVACTLQPLTLLTPDEVRDHPTASMELQRASASSQLVLRGAGDSYSPVQALTSVRSSCWCSGEYPGTHLVAVGPMQGHSCWLITGLTCRSGDLGVFSRVWCRWWLCGGRYHSYGGSHGWCVGWCSHCYLHSSIELPVQGSIVHGTHRGDHTAIRGWWRVVC